MVSSAVLMAYGLELVALAPVGTGRVSQTYRVRTGSGEYALRRHSTDSPVAIAAEQAAMRAAAGALPVPVPVPTTAGAWTWYGAGARWSLATWLPGTSVHPLDLTVDQAHALGTSLARLHRALGRLDPADYPGLSQHLDGEPGPILTCMALYRRLIAAQPEPHPFDDLAREWFAFAQPRLVAGSTALAYYRAAPAQVVHGDCWHPNLLFTGQEVTGILGWASAGAVPRLWEPAHTFGIYLQVGRENLPGTLERICSFLHGYSTLIPLTAAEAGMIPELYRWFRLHDLRPFQNHYILNDNRSDAYLAESLRTLQVIEAAGGDLRAALVRAVAPHRCWSLSR